MVDQSECLRHRLGQLENDCRRQVFDVIYTADKAVRVEVRKANSLGLVLCHSLPSAQHRDLIVVKNEVIKRLWFVKKDKEKEIHTMYLRFKRERQEIAEELIRGEGEIVHQVLSCEWFGKFRPVLFHRNQLETTDPDLPCLPFHLGASVALSLRDTLTRCNGLYTALDQIHSAEIALKHILLANSQLNISEFQEAYKSLTEVEVERAHIQVCRWNSCLQSSELLTSQRFRIKARLYQLQASVPREGNNALFELTSREELIEYSTQCSAKSYNYWVKTACKLDTALGRKEAEVDINYATALYNVEKNTKALRMYKKGLRLLRNQEGYRAWQVIGLQRVAQIYSRLFHLSKSIKWYRKALNLALTVDEDTEKVAEICWELMDGLVTLCRFEEAETIACLVKTSLPLSQRMCCVLGRLYITWEKFTEGEEWTRKCLAQDYYSCAHLNLAIMYLNMGKWENSEVTLRSFLNRLESCELYRVNAIARMSRCCVWRQDFHQARKWMQRAVSYAEKWKLGAENYVDGMYESGMLCFSMGDYARAYELFRAAEEVYRKRQTLQQQPWILMKLAEICLLTGNLEEAESCITEALEMSEELRDLSKGAAVYAVQGRVCLARQELPQAREWLHRAMTIQERVLPQTQATALTYSALGSLELAAGRNAEASERFTQALLTLDTHVSGAEAYSGLAEVYSRAEDWEAAKSLLEAELQLFKDLPSHPLAVKAQQQLASLQQHRSIHP